MSSLARIFPLTRFHHIYGVDFPAHWPRGRWYVGAERVASPTFGYPASHGAFIGYGDVGVWTSNGDAVQLTAVSKVDKSKLRRLAGRMNRFEADWLMGTINYAIGAGLDPADVIARGCHDWKVFDERAQAFARGLTREELEWFAENGGDLYTDIRRESNRAKRRASD